MQSNKRENVNVLCLQAYGLAPKMGCPHSSTRSSIVVALCIKFATTYAVPDQIKLKMLELSVRRGQSNFSTVYIFFQLRRKRLLL